MQSTTNLSPHQPHSWSKLKSFSQAKTQQHSKQKHIEYQYMMFVYGIFSERKYNIYIK